MRHCCTGTSSSRRSSGLSLPELVLAIAIFSIVMTSIAQLIRETVRYYNVHIVATEVQQQAIQAIRWISQELEEGSRESLLPMSENALVFGSPRDLEGKLQFEEDIMLWQKFVCYFVTELEGDSILMRGELLFEEAAKSAPPVPSSLTLLSFQGPESKNRIMARHIESVSLELSDTAEVEVKANLNDGAFTLKLKTRVEMGN